jgi:DNA-binding NtrC family response regulator
VPTEIRPQCTPADLTVIVADRHPFARAALAALLSYDGYRVFQGESFQKTLSYIDQMPSLGVLIADLETPEWRSIVRHAVDTTSALVIAMEGNHPFSEIYDLKARGIQICLQKPIVYSDVQKAIQRHFRIRQLSQRAREPIAAIANRLFNLNS